MGQSKLRGDFEHRKMESISKREASIKYDYCAAFQSAIEKAKSFNLATPEIDFQHSKLLTERDRSLISAEAVKLCDGKDIQQYKASCVTTHWDLWDHFIRDEIDSNAILTAGYIQNTERENAFAYRFSDAEIKRWLAQDVRWVGSDNIHVWITLSSLEIIDITAPATISLAEQKVVTPFSFPVVAADPRTEPFHTRWHPVIASNEFVRRLQGFC